jgi:elongation factor G
MPVKATVNGGKEELIKADSSKPFVAYVFKTVIDQFTGKISYFKVVRGTAKNDMEFTIQEVKLKKRVGSFLKYLEKILLILIF